MVNKLTEKELLVKAQYDDDAFSELYHRYYKLVYYVAYKMCKNDADAQDVTQETFVEVKRSLANLKNPQYFRLWLYRIIDSKCKKLFRKNKYACTDIEQDHILNEFLEQNKQFLPEVQLKYWNDRELMHHFIKELPYDQKYAIILYYMQQLTTLEIAELLEVPEGTIKSRLSVGRAALRKKIEAYERRQGIKLDFHESFGNGIMAAIISDQTLDMAMQSQKAKTHRFIDNIKAMNLSMKLALTACGAGIVIPTGLMLMDLYQISKTQTKQSETNAFPHLYFQGISVSTSKEAYFTLKMNICLQDMRMLSEGQREDALALYEALKLENGVYYIRLQESGWADAFDQVINK